jgi:hypothetical protein
MSQTPIYDKLYAEFKARRQHVNPTMPPRTPSLDFLDAAAAMVKGIASINGAQPAGAIMDEATLVERFVVQLDKPAKTVTKKAAEVKTLAGASYGGPSQE